MINQPLVSFIISVYNGEAYIERCIKSIFNQTYQNLEIIIIDDCSTDSTNLILKNLSYQSKIKINLIKNSINLGLTKSLNIAANIARGEWLARLDADDISKKDRIKNQINFAIKNSQYSIIGSSCDFINREGKYLFSKNYPSEHYQIKSVLEKAGAFFPHSSVIIKKDVFSELGGYNPYMKYSQDYELWLRASARFKIFSIKKKLVSVRIHDNRISSHNKGNNQLIYSRACLIAYWLTKDHMINYSSIYSKEKWKKYLFNVSFYLSKDSYYIGRQSYIEIVKDFTMDKIFSKLKDFILNFKNLFFYIIKFILYQELFLRRKSFLFIKIFI